MQASLESMAALAWLATKAGRELLAEAAQWEPDRLTRLTRLRKHTDPLRAAAAVELLELHRRGRNKFSDADSMFLTPEGLEQSTGERIARYRASRFPRNGAILDACCGIGGDARMLAEHGRVLAVDRNPVAAFCTKANALLPSVSETFPVHALCADVTELDPKQLRMAGIASAFFDPSRRAEDGRGSRRRSRGGDEYAPPLDWLMTLREYIPAMAVKVSPALDDAALQRYGGRVEFISDGGECKEACLWFGALAESLPGASDGQGEDYCATLLREDNPPVTLSQFPCDPPEITAPSAWLYEPDPAAIRAHLVPQVAAPLKACRMDAQIAYLTAETFRPTPFAYAYRVLDWMPFHLKQVQARLCALGRSVYAIKRRGVPLDPQELRKRLPGAPAGSPPAVVVLTRCRERPIAILCDLPEKAD